MKRPFLFLQILFIIILNGCGRDIFDVELPEGEPKLVVEGTINNKSGPQVVKLGWTTSFNRQKPVYEENAVVLVTDSEGNETNLRHTGEGTYQSEFEGKPGQNYHLSISINGKEYVATSEMPKPAVADSISVQYFEESLIREEGYYVSIHRLDPGEQEGYYRWMVWVNDSIRAPSNGIPSYFAAFEAREDHMPFNLQYPEPFKKGDLVRFHTIKMDRAVYLYYQGLLELMVNDGGLLGPVPVNPASNISGNALGIFQAISITETEILIE